MSRRRRDDPTQCGVLLVDKPRGPTSHDVVGWVRWTLGVRRVGHCGTLDPAATGLLVVAVGAATKLAPYLSGQDKGYRAVFSLGRRTDTGDAQGRTVDAAACPADLEERIPAALEALLGTHELPPPAYSAIHVDGARAHELARAGELDTLPARPMTVLAVEPGAVTRRGDEVEVEATVHVSKGTYVRSLAEALGERLGVPGHLASLHRIASGSLSLSHPQAVTGLCARPLEPGPRGNPRWRIEAPREAGSSREAVAQWLGTKRLDAAEAVPMPLHRVLADDCGQSALQRLASGQPVSVDDSGLPEVASDADTVAVAAARPGLPGLVIAAVTSGAHGDRLEPRRVIVPPVHP